jgi:tRNA A-37 threonylcarbamoyl transferase component Bud32
MAKFNFNDFKNLKPKEQYIFLQKLPSRKMGSGTARFVTNIGNGKVIKFAMNNAGLMQNKEEVKIFKKNEEFSHLVPAVYDYDPRFQWVLSEIVNPLPNNEGKAMNLFYDKTGIDYDVFIDNLEYVMETGELLDDSLDNSVFFVDIVRFAKKTGLITGDITPLEHWGINSDGRLVLLDYGFTPMVANYIHKAYNYAFNEPASFAEAALNEKKQFDFNHFKRLKPREQFEFLNQLPDSSKSGQGTSRAVYILGTGKVIKFAFNKAGVAQNKEEVQITRKFEEFSDIIPKVYDYDPTFHWIMSELVQPLSEESEEDPKAEKKFYQITGLDYRIFEHNLITIFTDKKCQRVAIENKFFQRAFKLAQKAKMDYGDLTLLKNMGISSEGNIVFLDIGMSKENAKNYYSNKTYKLGAQVPDSFKECLKLKNVYKSELLTEKKFMDIEQWKQLPPIKQLLFLRNNAEELEVGKGSSRIVYLINNKTVLKLARNEKGLTQNQAEVDAFRDPLSKGLVTKIFDYSPDYRWLISELARPIKNYREFGSILGSDAEDFFYEFKSRMEDHYENENSVDTNQVQNPLMGALLDFCIKKDLLPGDIIKPDSWGKTADGRLVLLDYGFTFDTYTKHYKSHKSDLDSDQATAVGA